MSRFNNCIDLIKNIFALGVSRGLLVSSPAASLERRKAITKRVALPGGDDLLAVLQQMEDTRCSRGGVTLALGLVYTGLRVGEARLLRWGDIDLTENLLTVCRDVVRGAGTRIVVAKQGEAVKNGIDRVVPLSGEARAFFLKLKAATKDTGHGEKVFSVHSCIKALQRACEVMGVQKLTHHSLRHYFVTKCFESGVDAPTISRWLGHQDGGALAMKVYGHLRDEHSRKMMGQVSII